MTESREKPDAITVEPPWQDDVKLEPTDAEIEAWAEDERRRRQTWVQGPTPEERAAYASRERERRLAELEGSDAWFAERARTMGLIDAQGAARGRRCGEPLHEVVAPHPRRAGGRWSGLGGRVRTAARATPRPDGR